VPIELTRTSMTGELTVWRERRGLSATLGRISAAYLSESGTAGGPSRSMPWRDLPERLARPVADLEAWRT
jgi:hypothetical protein